MDNAHRLVKKATVFLSLLCLTMLAANCEASSTVKRRLLENQQQALEACAADIATLGYYETRWCQLGGSDPNIGGYSAGNFYLGDGNYILFNYSFGYYYMNMELPKSCTDTPVAGDPCSISSGVEMDSTVDYKSADTSPLKFIRYYSTEGQFENTFVHQWRHNYSDSIRGLYKFSPDARPWFYSQKISTSSTTANYAKKEDACVYGWASKMDSAFGGALYQATARYENNMCVIEKDGKVAAYLPIKSTSPVFLPESPSKLLTIVSHTGDRFTFTFNGEWHNEFNPKLKLRTEANQYVFTNANGKQEYFNADGKLVKIRTLQGTTQILSYDLSVEAGGDGNTETLDRVMDDLGGEILFHYDAAGVLTSITTPTGDIQYETDANQNLSKVTYQDGASKQYLYENTSFPHHVTGVIDENGNRYTSWTYDTEGRVVSSEHADGVKKVTFDYNRWISTITTDVYGASRTYRFDLNRGKQKIKSVVGDRCVECNHASYQKQTFNADGLLETQTDWNGTVTKYEYTNDYVTRITRGFGTPEATITDIVWDEVLGLQLSIATNNRVTSFTYDSVGNMLTKSEIDTASNSSRRTTFSYNAQGLLESVDGSRTDLNDVTLLEYNSNSQLSKLTDALGHITEFLSYDVAGHPTSIKHQNGDLESLIYSSRGWLVSHSQGGLETHYNYDLVGQLIGITLPNGSHQSFAYDSAHRLTSLTDSQGNQTIFTLDLADNVTHVEIRNTQGTIVNSKSFDYDKLNQLVNVISGENVSQRFEYDSEGNVINSVDGRNNASAMTYDSLSRLTKIVDPKLAETSYDFDALGNNSSVTDPTGSTTTYQYNAFGEVTQQTSPDTGTTTFTYDSAGNVLTKTDARGVTVTYSYDALNRVISESYAEPSENIIYTYDESADGNKGIGRLTTVTDASGSTHYKYNAFGQVTEETQVIDGHSFVISYQYDGAGQLTGVTYPSGRTLTYSYNNLGQLSGVTSSYNGTTKVLASDMQYLPFGPLESVSYGNGNVQTKTYDLDYRLSSQTDSALEQKQYSYDLINNITDITHPLNTTDDEAYSYDALSRLLSGSGSYGELNYSYDLVGNRLTKDSDGLFDNYSYATSSHQLESVSGANPLTITMDAMGNTLTKNDLSFSYNNRGRLKSASKVGMNASYTYNFKGERVSKQVNGQLTYFIFNQAGQLIAEADANGQIAAETIYLNNQPFVKAQYSAAAASLVQEKSVNNNWQTASFESVGTEPVVFVGPASNNDAEPGNIQIQNVADGQFELRFAEWDYLDGSHGDENVSVFALPKGRYTMADGSIWEIGTVDISGSNATASYTFGEAFPATPTLILTAQTANDGTSYSARAKAVTDSGFKLRLNEEELTKTSSHATETIGYLAIYSATGSGVADFNGAILNYQLASGTLTHNWKTLSGYDLKVEEEQSKDSEVKHTTETIDMLLADGLLFAQDVATKGGDSATLRRNTASPQVATATVTDSTLYYYHNSHLGAPEVLTDDNQTIVWKAHYTPFGQAIVDVDNIEQNIRFPGQYFDSETGLHYNYFRDYDPEIGRYIQSDPIGLAGGINTYGYAFQNPVRYTDPTGLLVPGFHARLTREAAKKAGCSDSYANNLADLVAGVDSLPGSQDPQNSEAHHMANGSIIQSPEDALADYTSYISEIVNALNTSNDAVWKRQVLALYIRAEQDGLSLGHIDFQQWKGLKVSELLNLLVHAVNDIAISRSRANSIRNVTQGLIEQYSGECGCE